MTSPQGSVQSVQSPAAAAQSNALNLTILGVAARVFCSDSKIAGILSTCYSAFDSADRLEGANPIDITVTVDDDSDSWQVTGADRTWSCGGSADLIYRIEKILTVEVQKRRSELFFLHAAVIGKKDRCFLIVGESGAGKSTLCWYLCDAGLAYLSDELAPINLDTMEVEPYPRALCLKRKLNEMPDLPGDTIRVQPTIHIPVNSLPAGHVEKPTLIDAIVFLDHADAGRAGSLNYVSRSAAAARLYSNGLNQLAHERDGLSAVVRLTSAIRCFSLPRARLRQMHAGLMFGIRWL